MLARASIHPACRRGKLYSDDSELIKRRRKSYRALRRPCSQSQCLSAVCVDMQRVSDESALGSTSRLCRVKMWSLRVNSTRFSFALSCASKLQRPALLRPARPSHTSAPLRAKRRTKCAFYMRRQERKYMRGVEEGVKVRDVAINVLNVGYLGRTRTTKNKNK